VPLAVFAGIDHETLNLQALVGEPDGSRILRGQQRGNVADLIHLVEALADDLLAQGADRIIARI
jgi:hydroxymethylbilane synthase